MKAAVWHGDAAALVDLVRAIEHNCTCENQAGIIHGQCPAHQAMLDQGFADRLIFARYLLSRLRAQEFSRR